MCAMGSPRRTIALALTALLAVNGLTLWQTRRPVLLTDDRNHDDRADLLRWYDAEGRLVRLEVDTNFDGRLDRVVEFDPHTSDVVLETVDTNFNGTADLLRLYAHGRLLLTEHADEDARAPATIVGGALQPLDDPFLADRVVHPARDRSAPLVAVVASAGPVPKPARVNRQRNGGPIHRYPAQPAVSARRDPTSLRGPPPAHSL
jgi:hypothetical protein